MQGKSKFEEVPVIYREESIKRTLLVENLVFVGKKPIMSITATLKQFQRDEEANISQAIIAVKILRNKILESAIEIYLEKTKYKNYNF